MKTNFTKTNITGITSGREKIGEECAIVRANDDGSYSAAVFGTSQSFDIFSFPHGANENPYLINDDEKSASDKRVHEAISHCIDNVGKNFSDREAAERYSLSQMTRKQGEFDETLQDFLDGGDAYIVSTRGAFATGQVTLNMEAGDDASIHNLPDVYAKPEHAELALRRLAAERNGMPKKEMDQSFPEQTPVKVELNQDIVESFKSSDGKITTWARDKKMSILEAAQHLQSSGAIIPDDPRAAAIMVGYTQAKDEKDIDTTMLASFSRNIVAQAGHTYLDTRMESIAATAAVHGLENKTVSAASSAQLFEGLSMKFGEIAPEHAAKIMKHTTKIYVSDEREKARNISKQTDMARE